VEVKISNWEIVAREVEKIHDKLVLKERKINSIELYAGLLICCKFFEYSLKKSGISSEIIRNFVDVLIDEFYRVKGQDLEVSLSRIKRR